MPRVARVHTLHCYVSTCRNTSSTRSDLTFFCLTKNKKRQTDWLLAMGREDLVDTIVHNRYYTICEEHFEPSMIYVSESRKRLFALAMPTLCLPDTTKVHKNITASISTQTDKFANNQESMKEMKIVADKDSIPITADILRLREKLECLSGEFSKPELTELIICDEKNSAYGNLPGHSDSYTDYCLNLYYGSSQVYPLLQNVVRLPNLRSLIEKVEISTEISDRLMEILALKIELDMTLQDQHCILIIDSIPIKPHVNYSEKNDKIVGFHEIKGLQVPFVAKRALVLMLHGMFTKWQLPVGYALLADQENNYLHLLRQWMNEVIHKLVDIGIVIRIVTFASKIESAFFERRWIFDKSPFFYIKRKKIYFICDLKLLLNDLRNAFRSYDIQFNGDCVAKYKHIVEFYNKDKNSQCRLAPKLTSAQIFASELENDSVCPFEFFSRTVASGLSTYIDCKLIDKKATDTVELIVTINELIALFNSSNNINEANRLYGDHSSHMRLLEHMKIFFENLKFINPNNIEDKIDSSNIMRGFMININAYLGLYTDLDCENSAHVPVKILNQGTTEEFFKQIRIRCGGVIKPTANMFMKAYKELCISNLLKPVKRRRSEAHMDSFLKYIKRGIKRKAAPLNHQIEDVLNPSTQVLSVIESNEEKIKIPLSVYNHIDSAERHTLLYISGFLLNKCKEQHRECQSFKNYVEGTSENITINHISRYLLYSQRSQICCMAIPCNHFVVIVEKLEDVFRKFMRNNLGKPDIEHGLNECAKFVNYGMPPCPCFPWSYCMKLFFKLRINYTLGLNNREFERGQKRFVIPLLLSESYSLKYRM